MIVDQRTMLVVVVVELVLDSRDQYDVSVSVQHIYSLANAIEFSFSK